ncbi:MAG: efflux transporter outer membrane subunit [Alphaproteobacteria bacterium]|nr:efflux transporter outer membrane subunit [Alphaproteobacteria bacterium]
MRRAILLAALACAGCTVGPDYRKPEIAVPQQFRAAPAPASAAPADLSRWWTQFDDAQLQSLVERALKSNLDLQSAASRVREAREQEIVAGAAGLPQVNANGAAAHLHSNGDVLGGITGQPPTGKGTDIKLYSVGFDASWEIDVFGGVRRSVEQAGANTEAAQWRLRDAEVTLTAEVATDYLTLRILQARIALLRDQAKRQSDMVSLVAARAKAGFVTQLDVNQQNAQAENTAAAIPPLEAQARAAEHAIATLLAAAPDALSAELEANAPVPATPPMLPSGLPSDLLERRPDVREAERKLAAATAGIGIATADLYPKFDLLAGISFTSNQLSNLFSSNSLGEFGLGQIAAPIFNGGKTRANIREKEEETSQALLAYRGSVLAALHDAEDALTREASERRRLDALVQTARSAQSSVEIARDQYRAGLTTYINVLQAQESDLTAQDQLAQSRLALSVDLVSIYKALGGGWQP